MDKDDRSGSSTDGENLFINGIHWSQIKRVLVYAFIYEGASNWTDADGVVTISSEGQPTIVVKLDDAKNGHGMCGIALLENDHGNLKVTKISDYYSGHDKLDKAFGWGLSWVAGRKD